MGSLHVDSFTWILNVSNIENEAAYIDHFLDCFELVKPFQFDAQPRTSWKYNKMNVTSPMVDILLRRQL